MKYDLICIGGGSGGIASAKRAAEYGKKVLVIEKARIGGTCVNVGCVPKKISWHAAQLAEYFTLAKEYGFGIDSTPKLAWDKFVDKRDAFITKLNGIYMSGFTKSDIDYVEGHAYFVDNHSIIVNNQSYESEHIVIAVGGEPIIPTDIVGAEFGITSDGFFDLTELPKSAVIVGAGYIAVELAGVLNALGVETHLIIRGDVILKKSDKDITDLLTQIMQKDGINIHFGSKISEVKKQNDDELVITLNNGKQIKSSLLLWATGRKPLTDQIRIENTDVKTLANGDIVIDEYQNTDAKGIYAIGDITGQPTLTPAAIKAGRQLAERLFNNKANAKADFTYVPTVIFSHPALGSVGITEAEAKASYDKVKIYRSQFNPLLRSVSEHKIPTLMKMVCVGDEEKVVGLHVLGDFADEIIQGFSVAVNMGATKDDFDNTLAIHPTSGEEFVTMR